MIYIKSFYLTPKNKEIEYLAGKYTKDGYEDIIGRFMPKMNCYSSYYPFDIFPEKQLERISFSSPITIFYGGNGSGKTTLLNIIAEKTGIARTALYNKTPFFKPYLQFCDYDYDQEIPRNSMMIASDDVFNYMLNLRAINQEVDFNREQLFTEYNKIKYGTNRSDLLKVDFEDKKSIEASAIGCNCQFIIATHSPFLLAMKRSEIYDLDAYPVTQKKWTELHNIQLYREFFKKHENEFHIDS